MGHKLYIKLSMISCVRHIHSQMHDQVFSTVGYCNQFEMIQEYSSECKIKTMLIHWWTNYTIQLASTWHASLPDWENWLVTDYRLIFLLKIHNFYMDYCTRLTGVQNICDQLFMIIIFHGPRVYMYKDIIIITKTQEQLWKLFLQLVYCYFCHIISLIAIEFCSFHVRWVSYSKLMVYHKIVWFF